LAWQAGQQPGQHPGLGQVDRPPFDVGASGQLEQQATGRGRADLHPPQADTDLDHLAAGDGGVDRAGKVQVGAVGAGRAAQAPGRVRRVR
jgi:hypothetical protein